MLVVSLKDRSIQDRAEGKASGLISAEALYHLHPSAAVVLEKVKFTKTMGENNASQLSNNTETRWLLTEAVMIPTV